MTLAEYLAKQPLGAAADMARQLNCPPTSISNWSSGARPVPPGRCIDIERLTAGLVRCEDLRPDIDWGYLRSSAPREQPEGKRMASAI